MGGGEGSSRGNSRIQISSHCWKPPVFPPSPRPSGRDPKDWEGKMRQKTHAVGAAPLEIIPGMRLRISTHSPTHPGSCLTLQPHQTTYRSPSYLYTSAPAVPPAWRALSLVLAPGKHFKMQLKCSLFHKGFCPHLRALKSMIAHP